jgi:hypothetical protein
MPHVMSDLYLCTFCRALADIIGDGHISTAKHVLYIYTQYLQYHYRLRSSRLYWYCTGVCPYCISIIQGWSLPYYLLFFFTPLGSSILTTPPLSLSEPHI